MRLLLPSLLTLAMLPPESQAWSLGPRYYGVDLGSPRMLLLQKQQPLMQKPQQPRLQKAFSYTSPRYEISDTQDKVQVLVDVPGVKPEDIHVTFENVGSVLSIRGSRSSSRSLTSQFSQRFSVDSSVDMEKLTASLANGVLAITAPKDFKQMEENIRKIPVTVASTSGKSTMETSTMETMAQDDSPQTLEPEIKGVEDELKLYD